MPHLIHIGNSGLPLLGQSGLLRGCCCPEGCSIDSFAEWNGDNLSDTPNWYTGSQQGYLWPIISGVVNIGHGGHGSRVANTAYYSCSHDYSADWELDSEFFVEDLSGAFQYYWGCRAEGKTSETDPAWTAGIIVRIAFDEVGLFGGEFKAFVELRENYSPWGTPSGGTLLDSGEYSFGANDQTDTWHKVTITCVGTDQITVSLDDGLLDLTGTSIALDSNTGTGLYTETFGMTASNKRFIRTLSLT